MISGTNMQTNLRTNLNHALFLLSFLVVFGPSYALNDSIYVNSAGHTIFKASTSSIDSITFYRDSNLTSCYGQCSDGYQCINGACSLSCQAGLTNCGGTCTNLQTDVYNCGSCGSVVAPGHTCQAGAITLSCQAGLANCGGFCINVQTDAVNCGSCGSFCGAGKTCSNSVCK